MEIQRMPTNSPLDKLLNGGIEFGSITNVYGPAGSGKTNITLSTILSCTKKTLYIDTEGSFSFERFHQIGGTEEHLKNIVFYEPSTWEEQCKRIAELEKIIEKENIGLIIVDSLVTLYRLHLEQNNFQETNRQLATQYSLLLKNARKYHIPVLVTNQVYESGDSIEMTSRDVGKYWSKAIIQLKRLDRPNHRLAILKKHRSLPEEKSIEFEIVQNGFKEVGKLGLF
jgi:DNA repair protein RadB